MRFLILLLIIVPAFEIGLLILSGNTLGIVPTILLIIATGILGAWLAKSQGLKTLTDAQSQMNRGQLPGESILDGLCILVGGILLLTPGFITDVTGLFLLLPSTRKVFKIWLKQWLENRINSGQFYFIRR